MINVCKITTISQTVCILPSVPAHLLQLLRDGAGGSLLKTTGPNFKHFLPTPPHLSRSSVSPCLLCGAKRWLGAVREIALHRLLHLRRAPASVQHFRRRFGGTYPSLINDDDVSVKRNGNIFFPALLRVLVRGVRGAPLARLRRNLERGRTERAARSAQERGGGWMLLDRVKKDH